MTRESTLIFCLRHASQPRLDGTPGIIDVVVVEKHILKDMFHDRVEFAEKSLAYKTTLRLRSKQPAVLVL